MPRLLTSALLTLLAFAPAAIAPVAAEQFKRIGAYEIHYNALNSDFIPAAVARLHGLTRSANRGMVSVAVVQPDAQGMPAGLAAVVGGTVRNLAGQVQQLTMREVREQDALYYLGEFSIAGEDTYRVELSVKPAGTERAEAIVFTQALVGGR